MDECVVKLIQLDLDRILGSTHPCQGEGKSKANYLCLISFKEFYLDKAPRIGAYMIRAVLGLGKLSAIETEKVTQH